MPELPEVETFKNYLKPKVEEQTVKKVNVFVPKILKNTNEEELENILIGKKITEVSRIGKYIIFTIEQHVLVTHLRMEGSFDVYPITSENRKHDCYELVFESNDVLRYNDTRLFGTMHLYKLSDHLNSPILSKIAPEPWDSEMTVDYLYSKINNRKVAIKTLLLDQSIMSGLGNIYVDETLHLSKIMPTRKGCDVTTDEIATIISNASIVMKESIKAGGTTVRSYQPGDGNIGKYQMHLYAYAQTGKACKSCEEGTIEKTKVNGRGTHYCQSCQK